MSTHENSSTIVIAELKWIRKTTRPVELIDRDADIRKGIDQLRQIRQFVTENPNHLDSQVKLPRRTSEYASVYYLLLARDHWFWVEPAQDVAIVEFEALSAALGRVQNLNVAITDVLKYGWLPVEVRDKGLIELRRGVPSFKIFC